MNPVLRHGAAHVFVESLDAPHLSDGDRHHLERVLRIRPDDPVTVSDGAGRWAPARWSEPTDILLVGDVVEAVPSGVGEGPLTVGCALPKGDRPELIVQKLTELGLDRILFFETQRSVVRWDGPKAIAQVERLRRVARAAAMQSRRVVLPIIEVLGWHAATQLPALALAEPGGDFGWWSTQGGRGVQPTIRTVLIGPEGGFTDEELAVSARRVALSSMILRVETAAITAGILMIAGRFGRES